MNHYSKLSGQTVGRKLYYTNTKDFYWPALAVHCYARVRLCPQCACIRIRFWKILKNPQLISETSPLTSLCIYFLGKFIHTQQKNEYLLLITDRYTKMKKTVPMKCIAAAEVAKHFLGTQLRSSRGTHRWQWGVSSHLNSYKKYVALWTLIMALRQHNTRKQTDKWSVTTKLSSLRFARTLRTTHEIAICTLMR